MDLPVEQRSKSIFSLSRVNNHASTMSSLIVNPPRNIDEGLNLVPIQNKTALLHACMVCPALVQRESPPLLFLEFENYNYYAAAVRWAKYWDMRYRSFGADRAFLPIADLTGNGAIPAALIDYMATGVAVVLPPDDQHRTVLYLDRSRLSPDYLHWSNECRQKLGFALLQKIMLLSPNFVIIFFASSKPRFFPGMGEWFTDALNHAFPTKLSAIYFTCKSPKSRLKSFVATYLPVMSRFLNNTFRQFAFDIYIGDREELLKNLVLKGLHPEDLPLSVGGSWKYEVYDEWMRRQRIPVDSSVQESEISNGFKILAVTKNESNISMTSLKERQEEEEDAKNKPNLDSSETSSVVISKFALESVLTQVAAMGLERKYAYIEVLNVAPYLEQKEANLDSFLSVENGNAKQAAERVVKYWNFRMTLFENLAFLPLQQRVGGALNDVDLRTLKCGYISLLPNNRKGHNVLCCDASRLANDDEKSRLRCFFYMLCVATAQGSDGASLSILLIMNKLSFERTKGFHQMAEMLQIYPVNIAAIHIIRQPARLGINFFDEKVVPTMKSLFLSLNIPLHIHSGTPTSELRQDLASYGFESNNLPRSLGGGWSYEDFLRWRDQQLMLEESSIFETNAKATIGQVPKIPSLDSLIPGKTSNSSQALLFCSTDDAVKYPSLVNSGQQHLNQERIFLQHQSLLQDQKSFQLFENIPVDVQMLQFNRSYNPQQLWQIRQQLDQQQIQTVTQMLGYPQLLTRIQQQQQRYIESYTRAEPSANLKIEAPPAVDAAMAAVLNRLRDEQCNFH